jgi:hypothetical protein
MFSIGRAKLLIGVRYHNAFKRIGDIEAELRGGDLLFFRPAMDDPTVAYKGMRQVSLFARRSLRGRLRSAWEGAWQLLGRQSRIPGGWDVDHVLPVCWAEAMGFDYVLLCPIPRTPNRSAGAGLEKTAAQQENERMLARYTDVDISSDYAYSTEASIAKLMGVAPGPVKRGYPGLEKIKPDLKVLQALLSF